MTTNQTTLPSQGNDHLISDLHFVDPSATVLPKVTYSGNSAPQSYNEAYVYVPTKIHNGRSFNEKFDVDIQGFVLAAFDPDDLDYDDSNLVSTRYYSEVESLVKRETGASHVFAFDHTVRRGTKNSVRAPAHHVHNDYTENTGLIRAKENLGEEKFERFSNQRMIQINVWRSIAGVVEQSPLAVLDARTLERQDLVRCEIRFPDVSHTGEIYAVKHHPEQRWIYFPKMTSKEAILIKGYDSKKDGRARFTPHTAFELPHRAKDLPPRQSIETRTFAFYDECD